MRNLKKMLLLFTSGTNSSVLYRRCYLVGWISGLIMLRMKGDDSAVRFHAWQSIITFGIMSMLLVVPFVVMRLIVLSSMVVAWMLLISYWLLIAFAVFLWVFLMYKAGDSQQYRLYKVGDIALKLVDTGSVQRLLSQPADLPVAEDREQRIGVNEPADYRVPPEAFDIKGRLKEVVLSIATLYKSRDPYTTSHQERVAQLASAIAREMQLPGDKIRNIEVAAIVHDIGKIQVPSDILSKPGSLSNEEMNLIKTHAEAGYQLLSKMGLPESICIIVRQHHERLDGSGYPQKLVKNDIVPEARIMAVADIVEAMLSHRPYRPALGLKAALEEIRKNRALLYDAAAVDACLRLFTEKGFAFDADRNTILTNVQT